MLIAFILTIFQCNLIVKIYINKQIVQLTILNNKLLHIQNKIVMFKHVILNKYLKRVNVTLYFKNY